MDFMVCTACHCVVQVNNTGICLGCQQGFNKTVQDDVYKKQEENDAELRQLNDDVTLRQEGGEDAIKERQEPESNKPEYQDGDRCGKTEKTSDSNIVKQSREEQKEEKLVKIKRRKK